MRNETNKDWTVKSDAVSVNYLAVSEECEQQKDRRKSSAVRNNWIQFEKKEYAPQEKCFCLHSNSQNSWLNFWSSNSPANYVSWWSVKGWGLWGSDWFLLSIKQWGVKFEQCVMMSMEWQVSSEKWAATTEKWGLKREKWGLSRKEWEVNCKEWSVK